MTSTQCTQLTLERLDLALHGGKGDGIDLMDFSHTENHAYHNVEAVCNRLHCAARETEQVPSQCCNQHSPVSLLSTETWQLELPAKLSTPPFCYRTIHAPQNCQKLLRRRQSHCASELEQVSNNRSPGFLQSANDTTCSSAPESMIIFNGFPNSPDGRSELSQTDRASDWIPEGVAS